MTLKYLILSSDGEALIPGAGSTNQWDYKRKRISSKKFDCTFYNQWQSPYPQKSLWRIKRSRRNRTKHRAIKTKQWIQIRHTIGSREYLVHWGDVEFPVRSRNTKQSDNRDTGIKTNTEQNTKTLTSSDWKLRKCGKWENITSHKHFHLSHSNKKIKSSTQNILIQLTISMFNKIPHP